MYAFKGQEITNNIDLLLQTLDIVDKTTLELTKYLESYQYDVNEINSNNKRKKKNVNKAVKQLISTILALSLIYAPVGAHKLIKRVGEGKESVTVEITTYEKDKKPQTTQTTEYLSDNPEDKVYIAETIPSEEFNYDLVKTYDATNEKCEKVEDYYNLDLSRLPLISTENVTEKRKKTESKKVILEKVDFDSVSNSLVTTLSTVFYMIYMVLVAALEISSLYDNHTTFIIGCIRQLLEDISKVKNKDDAKELKKKTNAIKEMIMRILNSDKKLLDRFESEFEKNRDLMSDPAELLNKYNELRNKLTEAEYKLAISK